MIKLLYCEGGKGSPDIRLLSALLRDKEITIRPYDSKYGLGNKILAAREANSLAVVVGLRDRDFDRDSTPPTTKPRSWLIEGGKLSLGWYWDRKEVENYIVDPMVVQRALGVEFPRDYDGELQKAAGEIALYTAARTALAVSRVQFRPLPNSWGKEQGKDSHRFPEDLTQSDCEVGIRQLVQDHGKSQSIDVQQVLDSFNELILECKSSGIRSKHFMTFFSGKDLLFGLKDYLKQWQDKTPFGFRELILKRIEESVDDVWTWLPEWQELRRAIEIYDTDSYMVHS